MPSATTHPWVGLIMIHRVHDSVFHSLKFDGNINGDIKTIQEHLTTIGNGLTTVNRMAVGNSNKITMLESKIPTVRPRDIITTFQDGGTSYTQGNATFLHCGTQNYTISRNNYPQLADALGIPSNTNNFQIPYIADVEVSFDYSRKRARKTYICAKIS